MSDAGSPRTELGLAILKPLIAAYKKTLDEAGEAGRQALVEMARGTTRWPSEDWIRRHWEKHWQFTRTVSEYAAWAELIKNSAGTEVWACVHITTRRRTLVFVDHARNAIVWFDMERMENVSAFQPAEGTKRYLQSKDVDYWRLKETEL